MNYINLPWDSNFYVFYFFPKEEERGLELEWVIYTLKWQVETVWYFLQHLSSPLCILQIRLHLAGSTGDTVAYIPLNNCV